MAATALLAAAGIMAQTDEAPAGLCAFLAGWCSAGGSPQRLHSLQPPLAHHSNRCCSGAGAHTATQFSGAAEVCGRLRGWQRDATAAAAVAVAAFLFANLHSSYSALNFDMHRQRPR